MVTCGRTAGASSLEFLDQGGQKEIADGYAGANPERARLLPGRNFSSISSNRDMIWSA